jgi:acetyl esterase/lipase
LTATLDSILSELKAVLENPPATIAGFREAWDGLMGKVTASVDPVPGATYEEVSANGVPATWVDVPGTVPGRAVLFLHGGGYIFGSVATHRDFVARLARATMSKLLAVDYRLAPEDPYPAGIGDACTAYRWLLEQGFGANAMAIAGDSAGGGLTISTLLQLRDSGETLPACAATVSAWMDFEASGASMDRCAGADPFVQRNIVLAVASMYLGQTPAREASPIYAKLAGLPPLLLIAGEDEVLVDDSTRLAEAAVAEGVSLTLDVVRGMYHDFPLFDPCSDQAQQAFAEIGAFVDKWTS